MSFKELLDQTTVKTATTPDDLTLNSKTELPKDKAGLVEIYEAIQTGKFDLAALKHRISQLLEAEELKPLFPAGTKERILSVIETCFSIENQSEFVDQMSRVLEPIYVARKQHPQLFEDVEARLSMQAAGFIPLNERFSYGIGGDTVHIHLATSHEVITQIPALFLDAMQKLANIIRVDQSIKRVTATSWLIAGNKIFRGGLFEISDVPDETKNKHFKGEKRPIKMATISREKLLDVFGN
jgi:hypothetical protein